MASKTPPQIDQLLERNGLYYEVNAEQPYNGPLLSSTSHQGFIKDGLFNGAKSFTVTLGAIHHEPRPIDEYSWSATPEFRFNTSNITPANYKDGKQHGKEVVTYISNNPNYIQKNSEINYFDGKKEGLETGWLRNGKKVTERTWKHNLKDGLESLSYQNGQNFSKINYKDGKKDGLSAKYYENGQARFETSYKDDKRDGLETLWSRNGQKESETNYKNGKKEGLRKEWNASGELMRTDHYLDGYSAVITDPNSSPTTQLTNHGLNYLTQLIDEKIISVNITDYSPGFPKKVFNFFANETATDYVKQVVEEHGTPSVSAYDEEKHKEFVSQIDARYANQ